jgi:hypothetical protein
MESIIKKNPPIIAKIPVAFFLFIKYFEGLPPSEYLLIFQKNSGHLKHAIPKIIATIPHINRKAFVSNNNYPFNFISL